MTFVVAIDGPAGSGKSSVSKAAARQLGFGYVDTGATYRVLTWACVTAGAELESEEAVLGVAQQMDFRQPVDPDGQHLVVGDTDVTDAIRTEDISSRVSQVARHPSVRLFLNDGFRSLMAHTDLPGIIMEGRDITTVVAPDAPVRVLLTAEEEVRMSRRDRELAGSGTALLARDAKDRKVVDFLTAAPGVHTVDSTELSFDETVERVIELIRGGQNTPRRGASHD